MSIRVSVLHHTHLGSLAQTTMFSQQTHYPLSGPLVPLSNVTLQFVASLIWRVLISSYFFTHFSIILLFKLVLPTNDFPKTQTAAKTCTQAGT